MDTTNDPRFCDGCPNFDGRRCRLGFIYFDYLVYESESTGQLIDSDDYFNLIDDLTGRYRERVEADWIRHIRRPTQCKAG